MKTFCCSLGMPSSDIILLLICSAVVFLPVEKTMVHLVPSFNVYTHRVRAMVCVRVCVCVCEDVCV